MDAPLSSVHIIDVLVFTQPDCLWSSCILACAQPFEKDLMLNLDQQTSLVNEGNNAKARENPFHLSYLRVIAAPYLNKRNACSKPTSGSL